MGRIREIEDKWFKELRKIEPEVVIDGVIDEIEYQKACFKIVYILKEVNGGESWDLRDFVYNGARPQTWDNIARWTEGIQNINKELKWANLEENNEFRRLKYLKQIAAVNLKKTSGGYTSDTDEINNGAKQYKELIKNQIKLYEPDIIICCGTDAAFVNSCYEDKEISWQSTSRGIRYFDDDSRIIISYSHPEARISNNILYYAIVDAVKEIKGDIKFERNTD